jgi:hypothetical protein
VLCTFDQAKDFLACNRTAIAPHSRDNPYVSPAPTYCAEKMRLLDEFVAAVAEYLKIESAKLAAAARCEEWLSDGELKAARKRKDAAKEAIRSHQQAHGC